MGSGSECSGYDDKRLNDGRKRYDRDRNKKDDEKRRGMVCRDFLRGACSRGSSCKFQHPEIKKKMYFFCHDFQNGECRRNKYCRFIHSSHEDELYYKETGELPSHLLDWYDRDRSQSPEVDGVPICKEALWTECWRDNCRFKHVSKSEYLKIKNQSLSPCDRDRKRIFETDKDYNDVNYHTDNYYEPEIKRPRITNFREENNIVENLVDRLDNRIESMPVYENGGHYSSRPQPERTYMMLEEENMMLRERVTELKKRVDDLLVTNEFLLEQNAQLRLRDKNPTGLTTVTVPAVTITNTVPGANHQMQQTPTPQQMVNAAIRTVTASVATVPVSLAAVTPVSLAAVSMAPVQQMPPPVVTMAQQSVAAQADPQVPPPPLSMSISAPSAPLVSYPIVSRTVIQPPPDLRH